MTDFPKKDANDIIFYNNFLKDRMPKRIYDFHIHLNLKQHIPYISPERLKGDWAFECGLFLTVEQALEQAKILFEDIPYRIAGFPWPIKETDMDANNLYLKQKKSENLATPFMGTRPEWSTEKLDRELVDFYGFKPYPDFVTKQKGADVSIFEFLPHSHLEVLNKHKKTVVIHLPRKQRLADPENIFELLEIRQKYPDITIVIAHLGRCFCPDFLKRALEQLGSDIDGFYFDTSAVLNPEVYELAFSNISSDKIFYGTDAPILYFHGKRTWTIDEYRNFAREDYGWNTHPEGEQAESKYTFFLYEQLKAIFDSIDKVGLSEEDKAKMFYKNSEKLFDVND